MIVYLTYNDAPSGIFSSQVLDVVKYLNKELKADVKLLSFISIRGFFSNRKKIKEELPEAFVLPMFPGVNRWRLNIYILSIILLFKKPKAIIARSVLATQLALLLKKKNRIGKVVYDGRGAITAEWKEYGVVNHPTLINEIFDLEKESVLNSDFRISVSEQLVNYWQKEFEYISKDHTIIPCTLNRIYENVLISGDNILASRKLFGLNNDDVVFLYSGSVASWQSFSLLYDFIKSLLGVSSTHKVVFLSDSDENINKLKSAFPSQVFSTKVSQNEVPKYLLMADYGLLIREESITNRVASPVKFAEYLSCGLKVIISENLGDYTKFVTENDCGYGLKGFCLEPIDKQFMQSLARNNFTKRAYYQKYKNLINFING